MERFNRHMMGLARDSRGLTQSDLAKALGVQQGTVSKYEGGFSIPPADFIEDLARTLGYLETFFFEPGRPYGMPPFHYRKRKKLSVKSLSKIVAEMNIRRLHVSTLLRSYEVKKNAFIPEIDRDEYLGKSRAPFSLEELARQMREVWNVSSGPIPNMMELIEETGGIIIPCDFETDLIDAVSQRVDGLPVLFFVNMHASADRIRLTLAHELGHMLLHTTSVKSEEEMEDEADEFAGAFLLPASEVKPQLRQFNLRQLANMKSYWKVSMAAIAVRASRLNLVSPYQSKMFWIEMSKLGYRKREPHEPEREVPSLLKRMISFHSRELGYSLQEIASLFHLPEAEFQLMYGETNLLSGARSHLRVVK